MRIKYFLKNPLTSIHTILLNQGWDLYNNIYFNFHYLPFKQAIKMPVRLRKVKIKNNALGVVAIKSDRIYRGMITIGDDFLNNYWNNNYSILDIRGRLELYDNVKLGPGTFLRVGKNALMVLEKDVHSSSGLNIYSYYKIIIGEGSKLGWNSIIMDTDSHPLYDVIRGTTTKIYAPTILGKHCWVGTSSMILKGTHLADEITVKAGSIVSGRFNSVRTIIGGNPAKEIESGMYITEDTFYSYPPIRNKAY